tara:strand:- start:993 stop:1556 length:564 start_codon:yes stop_codon:yes gene_type:complete
MLVVFLSRVHLADIEKSEIPPKALASNTEPPMDDELQLCSFRLAGMCYCLPLDNVVEVSRCPDVIPVASSHPAISGLMNIRSRIVTTLNLRVRLNLSTREFENERDEHAMLVLVRDMSEELIGLQVDSIEDIITVETSQFEAAPLTLSPELRAMVPGAYKHAQQLVMLLELEAVLSLNTRQPLTIGL